MDQLAGPENSQTLPYRQRGFRIGEKVWKQTPSCPGVLDVLLSCDRQTAALTGLNPRLPFSSSLHGLQTFRSLNNLKIADDRVHDLSCYRSNCPDFHVKLLHCLSRLEATAQNI